jgi:nucleoside-diphosphate-sugar epimerase
VLNCAAVASFGSNPLIWKVNVEGTLRLAQRMAQVGGQRFLHVGTAMSCSPEPDSLVAESAEFRNAPSIWWNTPTRNQPSSS